MLIREISWLESLGLLNITKNSFLVVHCLLSSSISFVCLFFDVVASLFSVFILFCFLKRKKKKLLFQINENYTNFFSESKPGDKKKLREDKDWTVSNSTHPAPC